MKDRRNEVTAAVAAAPTGAVAEAATGAIEAAGWDMGDCHDLLHRPFTPACRELPGGPARHVSLWWQYPGRAGLRRRSACRFGRHRYLPYWLDITGHPDDAPDGLMCLDCGLS